MEKSSLDYMPKVQFIKTHPDAKLPTKNKEDTGWDVYAVEDVIIPPRSSAVVPIGLQVGYIPPGYWFRIEGRSGLGFKHSIIPHFGIIDGNYRGDCGVKLYNFLDTSYEVKKGDRCAQFVFYLLLDIDVEWGTEAKPTSRGNSGFGASGR